MYEEAERAAQQYPGSSSTDENSSSSRAGGKGRGEGTDGGKEEEALVSVGDALKNRLLFHIAHKMGNESKLLLYHQRLTESIQEDQLSLAAVHYLRSHFQEVGVGGSFLPHVILTSIYTI